LVGGQRTEIRDTKYCASTKKTKLRMRKVYYWVVILTVILSACKPKKHGTDFETLKLQLIKGHPLLLTNTGNLKDTLSVSTFMHLKSKDVVGMDVLKPADAVKIFGVKGRNGAVILNIDTSHRVKSGDKKLEITPIH
jgi:hypothetical protein